VKYYSYITSLHDIISIHSVVTLWINP